MNAEQSEKLRTEASKGIPVGGKSETEFVVNRSLSSTAAKSKGQNLLATESAEEKEARLRKACIRGWPEAHTWAWCNINHCCTLTVAQAHPTMLYISLVYYTTKNIFHIIISLM